MKRSFKPGTLGNILYYIGFLLDKFLSTRIHAHPDYQSDKQYLFAFWHGKQILPIFKLLNKHRAKGAVLVSPSYDGEILSAWLNKMGYKVIRGSSRHDNIRSLVAMLQKLREGYSLGLGVDGPLGPIHKAKPGMIYMAQKADLHIIPVGSYFTRKWVLKKAWDKLEIPKPFSRAVLYIGKPLKIEKHLTREEGNALLESAMHAAEEEAKRLIKTKR